MMETESIRLLKTLSDLKMMLADFFSILLEIVAFLQHSYVQVTMPSWASRR